MDSISLSADFDVQLPCDEHTRKHLYVMVVLPSGVAMFQGIGEQMAKECM